MGIRTLFDAFKGGMRTPARPARHRPPRPRAAARRLGFVALEDRAVPASFSVSDVSIVEGNSGTRTALVTVSLTGATNSGGRSVGYTTASGSAGSGSDFQSVSGTLSFGKNVTSKTIQIPVYGDTAVESDETFYVNLRNPKKATIADGQGAVTILNDDASISIGNVWLGEGNAGTTAFNFAVSVSPAVNQPVTVSYATADDTAAAGSDYVAASGTLTIPAGQTGGTITVLVNGDRLLESDETFYVNLSNPTGGAVTDGQGLGYISDDEPRIYISDASVVEGNAGTAALEFTVSLTSASDDPVTVDFATADGLATAGSDYAATSGTVTFDPGVTTQTIRVPVNGDLGVEADEDLVVDLSNPTNAWFADSQGWGTIQSDDNAVLHIDSYADWEPDPYYGGVTTFYFTVWLSAPSTEAVTVNFATLDGSAFAGSDYLSASGQLTFAPGQTSQTIEVTVLPDFESEWDETFSLILSDPSGNAVIQPGWETGIGTIYDNPGWWW